MPKPKIGMRAILRRQLTKADVHYSGDLVAGAKVLEFFGDAMTELCLKGDGVEGLLRAYHAVDFLRPLHPGDSLEITAEITAIGNTSRRMRCEALLLPGRTTVARAEATCVCR